MTPGKCILYGLCIQIASSRGEPLGLSFIGHGFNVRAGQSFDPAMEDALASIAAECVAACPTHAMSFRESCGPRGQRRQ